MIEVDLQALRRGDEVAFRTLVHAYHSTLFRLAMIYSPSRAVAEETVQETWLAVLRGLDGFAGRSSLRTWICRILVNIARRRSGMETRSLPFSVLEGDTGGAGGTGTVDPERFTDSGQWSWTGAPGDWSRIPEDKLLSRELHAVVTAAIAELPSPQREVITLRDVEGWSAAEVCALLDLEYSNQRVLLHRARGRVRQALEDYLAPPVQAA